MYTPQPVSEDSGSSEKSKSAGTLLRGGGRTTGAKDLETRPALFSLCGDFVGLASVLDDDAQEDEGMTRGGSAREVNEVELVGNGMLDFGVETVGMLGTGLLGKEGNDGDSGERASEGTRCDICLRCLGDSVQMRAVVCALGRRVVEVVRFREVVEMGLVGKEVVEAGAMKIESGRGFRARVGEDGEQGERGIGNARPLPSSVWYHSESDSSDSSVLSSRKVDE